MYGSNGEFKLVDNTLEGLPQKYSADTSLETGPRRKEVKHLVTSAVPPTDSVTEDAEQELPGPVASQNSGKRKGSNDAITSASKKLKSASGKAVERKVVQEKAIDIEEMFKKNPSVQAGLCAPYIHNTTTLVIPDSHVWVCYDAQGAIQSTGINFIKHFPHFLVFLLALQRLDWKDWGINVEIRDSMAAAPPVAEVPSKEKARVVPRRVAGPASVSNRPKASLTIHTPDPAGDDPKTIDTKLAPAGSHRLRKNFGIIGWGTQVFQGIANLDADNKMEDDEETYDLAIKVSNPDMTHTPKPVYIVKAKKLGEIDPEIRGHIPDIVGSRDFAEFSTHHVRKALGLIDAKDPPYKGTRIPRLIATRRLRSITVLEGAKFWTVFWQIFQCHFRLYMHGIEHGDISVSNLMFSPGVGGDNEMGVLIDFGLSHVRGEAAPSGWQRTGNRPFMALDLLAESGVNGNITRLYRHEAEAFMWVLIWISARFENKVEKNRDIFQEWNQATYDGVLEAKYNVGMKIRQKRVHPTSSFKGKWEQTKALAGMFLQNYFTLDIAATTMGQKSEVFPPPDSKQAMRELVEKMIVIVGRSSVDSVCRDALYSNNL